jgi:hypothetical protein
MKKSRTAIFIVLTVSGCVLAALWLMRQEGARSVGVAGDRAGAKDITRLSTGARGGSGDRVQRLRVSGREQGSSHEEAPAETGVGAPQGQLAPGEDSTTLSRAGNDPLRDQRRAVETWVAEGGEEGVARAIAAAKEDPALKEAVVRALGPVKLEAAAGYVAEALGDENAVVVCAAVAAWAELRGEEAVGDIGKLLEANRIRQEGSRDEVAVACVKALGGLMSSEALPVLEQELQWVVQREARPVYGLDLIEAVVDIGDSRGMGMLEQYADALQGKLSGAPMVRREQMLQIGLARLKAADLR